MRIHTPLALAARRIVMYAAVVMPLLVSAACRPWLPDRTDTGLTLLETNTCLAPCFHGITPGETSEPAARALIAAQNAFVHCGEFDLTSEGGTRWTECEAVSIGYMDQLVDAIAVAPHSLTMEKLLSLYGPPSVVIVERVSRPDQGYTSGTVLYCRALKLQANLAEARSPGVGIQPESGVTWVTFVGPRGLAALEAATGAPWSGFGTYRDPAY